jgi:outer membrane receptor protein involved in Fe transport
MNWYSKYWTEYRNDTMFIKYISRKDGKVYDFDPSMKSDPEFSYMFTPRNDNRFIAERYFPTMLFNLNVSKEIGDIFTASFYVNNLFNSRPLYKSKQTGERSELGIPIFFGFEFKVSIK